MKEICDFPRIEPHQAQFYMDDDLGRIVHFEKDAVRIQYGEFMKKYDQIRRVQAEAWRNFVEIGHALLYIRENKLYHAVVVGYSAQGYASFYKFCQDVFGYGKQTVCNLINVALNFGDESGRLSLAYSMYSYSQLIQLADIDKTLRDRIPAKTSWRNIAKLKELYREYKPRPGSTIETDLAEWKRRHDAKLEEAGRKRNAINFFPANEQSVQPVGQSENRSTQTQNSDEEVIEDGENNVISTPSVSNVTFDSVRRGLIAQLSLLTQVDSEWTRPAQIIERALQCSYPFDITSRKEYRQQLLKDTHAGEYLPQDLPPAQKYVFKNDTERKAFLSPENAAKWPLWIDTPALGLTYRRIDFLNGDYLVARFGHRYGYDSTTHKTDRVYVTCKFYLCTKEKPVFDVEGIAPTYILDYLKDHKIEISGTISDKEFTDLMKELDTLIKPK